MGDFSITLPYPPTINHYWRTYQTQIGAAIRYAITPRGKEFRRRVIQDCMLAKTQSRSEGARLPLKGSLSVVAFVYPPDRRKRDLDNILKPLLDSLEHAGIIENDSDITTLMVKRCKRTAKNGKVYVTVSKIA